MVDNSGMDGYAGSRLFSAVADYVGLPVDQTNFLISQLVALVLAKLYRTVLHPSKTTPAVRHAFGLICGIVIAYFCFGNQAVHLAGLPAICYVIIITQNPHIMHGMVLMVSLIYLSCVHLHRQYYDYGSYHLDITGPLMVIVQKMTSLAFSLHDGLTKKEEDMTENQKCYALYNKPRFLEFFSYSLLFPSLMAGPTIFYHDYIEFIEGSCYTKKIHKQTDKDRVVLYEPNPTRTVIRKIIIALTCALIFVLFLPKFPMRRAKEEYFLTHTSLGYKFWYLTLSTTLVRFKYYFAWVMADAVCNNCGLGFNPKTNRWDRLSNVDIFQFEFGTSLRESIEAWNKGTNAWLRLIVYERVKTNSMILTYGLSALWHGFHPGYYLTFFSGALFTFAARIMRKHFRNHFIHSAESKLLYDLMTFIVTRIVMVYITFPFVMLEFWPSIAIYNRLYWFMHAIGGLGIVFVPKMFVVPRSPDRDGSHKSTNGSGIALALKRAAPYSADSMRHQHD